MDRYLASTDIINWRHPSIVRLSGELARGHDSPHDVARSCFEWVRDTIKHSYDFKLNPVTCTASDVLRHKTGYCYAKSHLLAALLRAQNIPAGFCYQRLSIDDKGPPYSLHGLNALFLPDFGWYRVDPRGNKEVIDARFTPPVEQLAFSARTALEADFPEIWAEPLPMVVEVLTKYDTYREVYAHLPDIEVVNTSIPRAAAVAPEE